MILNLVRYSYAPTETEGQLFVPGLGLSFFTMERAWCYELGYPAGIPAESCVPEGDYAMIPYKRLNGHEVWALVNESLGVYFEAADTREDWHRSKILIHPGNTVKHSMGCILPGRERGHLKGKRAVMRSGFRENYAMDIITKNLGAMSEGHTLKIRQIEGAHGY